MNPEIDIKAVLIANLISLMLSILLFTGNFWRKNSQSREDQLLVRMILVCMLTSGIEPLTFLMDGTSGPFFRVALYSCNLWTFFATLILGPLWVLVVSEHLSYTLGKVHKTIMAIICLIGALTLIINFFYPLLFWQDENNVYQRGPLYVMFLVIEMIFITDGLYIYIRSRLRSGRLKFFPMWQFLIPIFIGVAIQLCFYGVSTIWPCFSVAITGLVISLQNENIFRDGLTGLYNKSYLDNLKNKLAKRGSGEYIVMMLDMNNFKRINDDFGHSEGDEALKRISRILTQAIGEDGTVMRYAGDEFVILMNTVDGGIAQRKIDAIRSAITEYNENSGKPYELSVAIGENRMNLSAQTIDEILSDVDQRMYDDKKAFYESHLEYDRRRS